MISPCLQWLTRPPDPFGVFTELRRTTDGEIDTLRAIPPASIGRGGG
jgi:hypothetical protein